MSIPPGANGIRRERATLKRSDGQQYFGSEHVIYYLPSASVLPFIRKQISPGSRPLLAVAQRHADGMRDLSYAEAEARAIATLFNAKAPNSYDLSKASFLKTASDYRVLHIAAHSQVDPVSPMFSRIWLAPGDESGALTVHEVYDLRLPKTDLVVLSACETQLGARSKGDDIVGLNRAFLYAGASSVIASLWAVDDQATGVFMRLFYTHLKRGMGKAEALREAQSETRRQFPNPYYWAAFVMTGDPGPVRAGGGRRRRTNKTGTSILR